MWELRFTTVPRPEEAEAYIAKALHGQREGRMLPWAVRELAGGAVVGSTRYHDVKPEADRVEIGYTWYAERWQRSFVNTALVGVSVAHFARGEFEASDAVLDEIIARHGGDAPDQVAELYGSRGDADNAFKWLERTYADRDPGLSYMKMDPFMKALHGDPRWQPLLETMRLAD